MLISKPVEVNDRILQTANRRLDRHYVYIVVILIQFFWLAQVYLSEWSSKVIAMIL